MKISRNILLDYYISNVHTLRF